MAWTSSSQSCELIHPLVSERLPRRDVVVEPAEDAHVFDCRWSAERFRDDVIELDPIARPADAARFQRPLAPAAVADPHLTLDRRRYRTWRRGPRLLPGLLDQALPPRVLCQDQVQPRLENPLRGRAGPGV